ncbi:MAG: D-alanyl-D-alanine carboxypeptidase/D-alanyl-D-alanine-endopeptidase [Pseudomonadota bacterium]
MTFLTIVVGCCPLLHATAQTLPEDVSRTLNRFNLSADDVSIEIRDLATGDTVLRHRASIARNPASTMKLVTTYAALNILGPGYQWRTEVHTTDDIDANGVLDGDLILRGGGDPYLVDEEIWRLTQELWRRGLRRITGDIVVDESYFSVPEVDPGAFDSEPLRAYKVQPNALLTNFKVVRFWFETVEGSDAVRITMSPNLPNLAIRNELRSVPGRCRGYLRGIEVDANANANQVRFKGSFPSGCKRYSLARSLLDHDSYAYGLFVSHWRALGGEIDGDVRREALVTDQEPLLTWRSRGFSELMRLINKNSNNVMTRQVFLTVGAETFGAPASLAKARDAVNDWLVAKGFNFPHLLLDNGAGLSRDARFSTASMCALLVDAWHSPLMPEFQSSLSLSGIDGTFARRHKQGALTARAHVKTGRLDDVTALAGYLQAADGRRYALSVMHNATDVHRGSGEAVQDAVLRWLYQYQPVTPEDHQDSASDVATTAVISGNSL